MNPITVVIADDQPLILSSLKLVLETDPDITVVATAENGRQAISAVSAWQPDVVLMDIQMPQMDGIAATAELAGLGNCKILVLTTFNRDDYLFDALDAGASGFLLKNTDPEQLIHAVHQVAAGHGLLAPEVTLKLIRRELRTTSSGPPQQDQALLAALTTRERQVLTALGRGHNNQEIATMLGLREATVKTHVSNLLAKTRLRDRVQAVLFAHRVGLIQ